MAEGWIMNGQELGQQLRALRAAQGRTVAAVATDAGLSVPYVANLENGRGNPTVDALARIADALRTRLTIGFAAEDQGEDTRESVALPAALVRLSRGARFRRDIRVIADAVGDDPSSVAVHVLSTLARLAAITKRELGEPDWLRLLDAILLVAVHTQPTRETG
jgi:transcriptional regulator with XRE-family HTH domain